MSRTDPIQNLEWKGNSRAMYNAVLGAVPSLFRGAVKKNIAAWVVQNNINIVTEDLVFKAVNEIAPADLARNRIIPELNKLRTSNKETL